MMHQTQGALLSNQRDHDSPPRNREQDYLKLLKTTAEARGQNP